jgi:hypothetical protein
VEYLARRTWGPDARILFQEPRPGKRDRAGLEPQFRPCHGRSVPGARRASAIFRISGLGSYLGYYRDRVCELRDAGPRLPNRIVSPLVLGLLFFAVVTPIGLLMRMFGQRPLALGFDKTATSYWVVRTEPTAPPGSMRKQF